MVISIISIILLVILSIILLLLYKKEKKKLKKEFIENCQILFEQELEKNKQLIEEQVEEYKRNALKHCEQWRDAQIAERQLVDKSLEERKRAVEEIIEQLENRRREAEKSYQELLINGQKNVEERVRLHEATLISDAARRVTDEETKRRAIMEEELASFLAKCTEQQNQKQAELYEVCQALDDFKKKQTVINEEILRRRELEEKQDFYRVLIGQQEIDDIQCLLSIREKLIYRENLDKLIYDVYISKQVAEMTKRVLKGAAPSGIYKITRLKTGEIYIGKSTDVKKRWTEHCKTAYGVGTIAHSVLHTTIKKDGIENFTFELLEEVPKDKLTEREKYWITFYDSKNYGMNMREG